MAVTISIAGVDRSSVVLKASLRIRDALNQRVDTATFTIQTYEGQSYSPNVNDEVIIYVGATKVFGGAIVRMTESVTVTRILEYSVECKDYSQYLDRLLVLERYTDMSIEDIINDIIDTYASDFTVAECSVPTVVSTASFDELYVSECLTKLANLMGYVWFVDSDKGIHFVKRNTDLAPFSLTDTSDNYIFESLRIKKDFSQIRNEVIVRGGEAEHNERTEYLSGDGTRTDYPLANKFSSLPVVVVASVPKTVGIDTIGVDETAYDALWSFQQKSLKFRLPPASGTNNISVIGTPLLPVIVSVTNDASVTKYGTYQFKVYNETIRSRNEAIRYAQAELQSYADTLRDGSFETYTPGLHSGQTITISSDLRGLNESYIIQSVDFEMISEDLGLWKVSFAALKSLEMIEILQGLLKKEVIVEGTDDTLLSLKQLSDEMSIEDTMTIEVFAESPYYYGPDTTEAEATNTHLFILETDPTYFPSGTDRLEFDLSAAPAAFWDLVKSDGADIRVYGQDGVRRAVVLTGFDSGTMTGTLAFDSTGVSTSVAEEFAVFFGDLAATLPLAASTYGSDNVPADSPTDQDTWTVGAVHRVGLFDYSTYA